MKKLSEFKIRASACGKIMGKRGLGKTGESYLKMWCKEKLFNRRGEIKSKYLDKGNIMEDNSLDLVAKNLKIALLQKNEESFENDYITGTPDAIIDQIIDVKSSWSWETFPLMDSEIPSSDYDWQLQCYMALTGKKSAQLVYTLLDTPMHLIEREAYWYAKNNGFEELSDKMLQEFVAKMTYSDIPEEMRYKSFSIDRDEVKIESINQRVLECRAFIESL